MTGSVTGIRRRRTVAGRRETSHLPPDRAFYGQTLNKAVGTSRRVCEGENENRTISPKNKGVINIPPVQLPHLG